MQVKNYLLGYKDLYILQDPDMFSFSLDSVLLPNFIEITPTVKKILDIGTGNAPIPLILSKKTKAEIIGVEIQKEVYELAVNSVKLNNLDKQIKIVHADIKEYSKTLPTDSFDLITCNPPYFKVAKNSNFNESNYKTIARHEVALTLEDIMQIAKKLLKNNGKIAIVHRPERLVDIIEVMRENNITPKKIQFVYPGKNKEANILLISGTKNGKPGIKIMPPLYSHLANGKYTNEIKKYFS